MRIPTHLFFLMISSALYSMLPAHAQNKTANAEKSAPEPSSPIPYIDYSKRRLQIYGFWVEMSRNDLNTLLERNKAVIQTSAEALGIKKNLETKKDVKTSPRGKRSWSSAIITGNTREALATLSKEKRANVKDMSVVTVTNNLTAQLCFVEPYTISWFGPETRTIILKRYVDIIPTLNNDDTIAVVITPGLRTQAPPSFNEVGGTGSITSGTSSLMFNLRENATLVCGDVGIGNSENSKLELFFFTFRTIEPDFFERREWERR